MVTQNTASQNRLLLQDGLNEFVLQSLVNEEPLQVGRDSKPNDLLSRAKTVRQPSERFLLIKQESTQDKNPKACQEASPNEPESSQEPKDIRLLSPKKNSPSRNSLQVEAIYTELHENIKLTNLKERQENYARKLDFNTPERQPDTVAKQ